MTTYSIDVELKDEHFYILEALAKFLEKHPELRFGQALASLDINEIEYTPGGQNVLRDIFYDLDEDIQKRVESSIESLQCCAQVICDKHEDDCDECPAN